MASASNGARQVDGITGMTAKTRSVIEGFTARLGRDIHGNEGQPNPSASSAISSNGPLAGLGPCETEEDLERQLKECFDRLGYKPHHASGESLPATERLEDWCRPVTDGVVERILAEWAGPQGYAWMAAEIRNQVIERLVERVLEHLPKKESRNSSQVSAVVQPG